MYINVYRDVYRDSKAIQKSTAAQQRNACPGKSSKKEKMRKKNPKLKKTMAEKTKENTKNTKNRERAVFFFFWGGGRKRDGVELGKKTGQVLVIYEEGKKKLFLKRYVLFVRLFAFILIIQRSSSGKKKKKRKQT